ncbi:pectin acetylesterase 5-like [Dioscorea cayenensis subsp. rotundata]|uniref:Pectin acetylesterase n=1 Tax=Dioscorea cayennensis subsp. rotundata TaxID=55577 RepID=A0AB40BQN1_DIOCR|nr:pectin acetylesterase 5-like [Dioscorea cayenensis subsp. rotundata]XP_039129459.1 pectin acetylesterase 5-like [Dioscorea cayenensis subsp. rotundata]
MAASMVQLLRLWWRRGGRDRVVAFAGFGILVLTLLFTVSSLFHDAGERTAFVGQSDGPVLVDLTLVHDAEKKGAVCLDGSPPGYYLHRGFGSGADSWVVHLEGGGWCDSIASCSSRSRTPLGSSHYFESQIHFYGILNNHPSLNPDFYNWNRVKVRYCDGASMAGDVDNESQNSTNLFFRGKHVWEAVMHELLSKGLANAKQALLTGCSAGGLATFIHCDDFQALLPKQTTVKCLPDAGFFLNAEDISGKRTLGSFYHNVVHLQDLTKHLSKGCISKTEPSQCFFPQEFIKYIRTPLFILNPAYDAWQVQHVLAPYKSDPQGDWQRCRLNIHNCDQKNIEALQGFRNKMLNALTEFRKSKNGGMFINSCFTHCQTHSNITWHSPTSPKINNRTIAEAVGDWFFNRREAKEIDCPYPCNPTCYHLDLNAIWPGA